MQLQLRFHLKLGLSLKFLLLACFYFQLLLIVAVFVRALVIADVPELVVGGFAGLMNTTALVVAGVAQGGFALGFWCVGYFELYWLI